MSNTQAFYVYNWLVEPAFNKLSREEETQQLEPLAMDVLVFFASNAGDVISRDQLVEDVWQGRIVGDHAIYRIINQLRKVLGESSEEKYFQTIRKKGYRFIAEVKPAAVDEAAECAQSEVVKQKETNPAIDQLALPTENATSPNNARKLVRQWPVMAAGVGVVCVLFAILSLRSPFKEPVSALPSFSSVFPVTNLNGEERSPSFSSDGQMLAFSYRAPGSDDSHIYYQSLDTRELKQVSFGDGVMDSDPKFSPDNTRLAYFRRGQSRCEVLIQNIKQANSKPKTAFQCKGSDRLDFVWSHDGNEIFYTGTPSKIEPLRVYRRSLITDKQVQITNPSPGGARGDLKLALSPDGKELAIIRDYNWGDTNVFLLNLESGKEQRLFPIPGWQLTLSWSHDGRYLFYSKQKNTVDAYSLETGVSQMVAKNIEDISYAVGSPVAYKIAVETGPRAIDIWSLDLQNPQSQHEVSDKAKPFVVSSVNDLYPAFANTSKRVAFVSSRSGNLQIWIREEDGKEYQLTRFAGRHPIRRIRWSPDDRYILSDRSNFLYWVNTETGAATRLTTKDHWPLAETASWSHDGKHIYFSSEIDGDWQIYKMKAGKNTPIKKMTIRGGYSAQESADGKYLYYLKYYKPGLWRIPISDNKENPEEVLVVKDIDVFSNDAWTIKKEGLYYFNNNRRSSGIYFVANEELNKTRKYREDVDSQLVMALEPNFRSFSINFDSSQLLFPKAFGGESAIVMMEAKVAPAAR